MPSTKLIPAEFDPNTTANAFTVENMVPIIEPKYKEDPARAPSKPLLRNIGIKTG